MKLLISSTLAASTIALYAPASDAQWWQRHSSNGYNTEVEATPGAPISRDRFRAIHTMGGELDEQGRYTHPIPTEHVYGQRVEDGLYLHPMEWQPQHGILFEVQDGYIRRQDYQLNP